MHHYPESQIGNAIHKLMAQMFPICRSITGNGVRETLSILQDIIPLTVHEVKSGTPVFDWHVPKEWNVSEAYIKDSLGKRIVDFKNNNLHVVSYSLPVNKQMALEQLKPYLHTLPEHPEWIPYRASYYKETWGFCLTHQQYEQLEDDTYEVVIDAKLEDGSLSYGELFIPGKSSEEILIYTHICHPSLCNDNLSGIALNTYLARQLMQQKNRYSYRFVFAPATIGSITWLSQNRAHLDRIKHGLVITLVGDKGMMTYKKSRSNHSIIDQAAVQALQHCGQSFEVLDFSPYGYDERQFCSPGINLPMGRLTRTPNACYDEYHSSADNLDFVKAASLSHSFNVSLDILNILEGNAVYINKQPCCEPQLGRRGLYEKTSAQRNINNRDLAMLWVLNLCDGEHSLLDIAERSGLDFASIRAAASDLLDADILEETEIQE